MLTGFIGLGAMGGGMARNLQRAGLLHAVWNRTPAKAQALAAELHCTASAQLPELARSCEAIVMCVSADQDVLEVVAALAPALRPGTLVIDCSTVSADTARTAGAQLAAHGVDFLDAPVSSGVEGAAKGTLAIMVGGSATALQRAEPVLRALGTTITHFGPQGAGQAAKATNQIMVAGIIRANAEALAFASAQGQGDRHARARRRRQLVSRAPRPEHAARQLSGRLPGAAAPEGPEHLPRDGAFLRRRAVGDRGDAGRLRETHCRGLRR